MFQTCRISWQDVTRSDKYSLLSYVVFSCSSTLIARNLRAQHHISGKTTFCTLCAPTHKVQEICLSGSEGGAKLSFVPTPIQPMTKDGCLQSRPATLRKPRRNEGLRIPCPRPERIW